ncbi:MAG TPA: hypothetical protein VIH22_11535 [Cyclobacteriaceae bacterium]
MKMLASTIKNRSLAQEAVNCWLRYVLSQPVNLDIPILLFFIAQFIGLAKISSLLEQLHSLTSSTIQSIAEKLLYNAPLYELGRA